MQESLNIRVFLVYNLSTILIYSFGGNNSEFIHKYKFIDEGRFFNDISQQF